MGRVYDALKRASAATESDGQSENNPSNKKRRSNNGAAKRNAPPPAGNGHGEVERPWDRSSIFTPNPAATTTAAHTSASTAHTEENAGSALSGVTASRAAGATLDAAGATRTAGIVAQDITAERVEPHLVAITQPRSPYCEQFRSLRTRVLHAGQRKKMQTIVVTSASVAEGKTLTTLNLAWLLAQTDGVRALVIDGDLRQPCAASYLGMEVAVGLSEVLSGEMKLEEALIRLEPSGLHLLPGGAAREDVAELLSGPRFDTLLAEARRMFDYILIDAPPLGVFTDANLLINRADGALLVVQSGKTRYAVLDRLLESLPREKMLGVVLNRSNEQLDDTSYYYQRRYYQRDKDVLITEPSEALPAAKNIEDRQEVTSVS